MIKLRQADRLGVGYGRWSNIILKPPPGEGGREEPKVVAKARAQAWPHGARPLRSIYWTSSTF